MNFHRRPLLFNQRQRFFFFKLNSILDMPHNPTIGSTDGVAVVLWPQRASHSVPKSPHLSQRDNLSAFW